MARPLRVEYEGAVYHITSRGNAGQRIFLGDRDRRRFLKTLGDAIDRFGWLCFAYCLMGSHYHLLIETPQANLSCGMHFLNGAYSLRFNRTHRRAGHLFQGRYKAILVERESYLLELVRYIALNPVRAKRVKRPDQWPWSSYRATVGRDEAPQWLQADWILAQLGGTRKEAVRAFRRFVRQGRGLSPWEDLTGGWILGSEQFVAGIRPFLDEKRFDPEIRVQERHADRPPLERLFEDMPDRATRNERIYDAFRTYHYTLREIGVHLGLSSSTISAIAKRVAAERECEE